MQRKKTTYIAETDENGVVICVWVDAQEQRRARLFDPKRARFDMDAEAEFVGAKPQAMKFWMARMRRDIDG